MGKPKPASNVEAPRYHHGDLRAALLAAAEVELAEKGIEGFSLRGVAKRAGVSHAAPAHHFGDANGLLTALAAEGFERFLDAQKLRQAAAVDDGLSQLTAAGLGYIDFAMSNAALFRLIFSSDRPDFENPVLHEAAEAAFNHLVGEIGRLSGANPYTDKAAMVDVMAAWAVTHGLADLLSEGRMKFLHGLPQAERETVLTEIIRRAVVRDGSAVENAKPD